jgi:hypothetical protein
MLEFFRPATGLNRPFGLDHVMDKDLSALALLKPWLESTAPSQKLDYPAQTIPDAEYTPGESPAGAWEPVDRLLKENRHPGVDIFPPEVGIPGMTSRKKEPP